MRRVLATVVAVVVVAPLLAGCARRETDNDRLRAVIEHTRRLSTKFEYEDIRPEGTTTVQGLVQDDFRFKSRVFYDGQPGYDEVVIDDVLAMRVLQTERLPDLIDIDIANRVDQSTEIKGVSVVQALKSRRWVQDASGAPVISGLGQTEANIGRDPAFDAVTVLDYVLRAMEQSDGARKFDPDTLSPTYRGIEDPFEQPKGDEIRYDLVRPGLPSPGAARSGTGGQVAVPATKHFRKLAVYVSDGKVTRVEERIELTGRSLDSFVDWLDLFFREANNAEGRAGLKRVVDATPKDKLGDELLSILSKTLRGFGEQPILVRDMRFVLEEHGSKIEIALPDEQKVQGKLTAMVTSGTSKKPKQATGGGPAPAPTTGGTGGAGGTTETTLGSGAAGDRPEETTTSTTSPPGG